MLILVMDSVPQLKLHAIKQYFVHTYKSVLVHRGAQLPS